MFQAKLNKTDISIVCMIDLGVSPFFLLHHSREDDLIATESKSILNLRTKSYNTDNWVWSADRGWIYFPLDVSGLNLARERCCIPPPNQRTVAVTERKAGLARISMMRYWLLACNFILCSKWQTRYHTVRNPRRPCTDTHTHTQISLLLLMLYLKPCVCQESLKSGVFTLGLTPERGESMHTYKYAGGHTLGFSTNPPPSSTSDICHSQSVQQARHLSSVVLPLWRRGGKSGRDWNRESWRMQSARDRKRGRRVHERGMRAASSGWLLPALR